MEYIFTDINMEMDIHQMEVITKSNIKTIKLLNEEVERLKSTIEIETKEVIITEDLIHGCDIDNDEDISVNDTIEEEINYYYKELIESINQGYDNDSLVKLLPSLKNSNYTNIIYGMLRNLLKEINEIKEFIELEKDELSSDELKDFKNEIVAKQDLIRRITTANEEKIDEEEEKNEEILNNIVFLETASGNVYALEDLNPNVIPSEYYAGFYDLIKSIEEGTFKNVKFLTSGNNKTAGISEVKGFKRRVIFDRVGYNTYVIVGIFTKKSDKDKSYMEPLKNRIAIYRKRREQIVSLAKDSKYLEEQKVKLDELYNRIKPKTADKCLKKGMSTDE